MNPKKSAKWIVGTVGVAFSAFVLSQFSPTPSTTSAQTTVNGQSSNSNGQSVDPFGNNSSGDQYSSNDNGDGGQNDQGGGSNWSFDNSQGNSGSSSDLQSGASGH